MKPLVLMAFIFSALLGQAADKPGWGVGVDIRPTLLTLPRHVREITLGFPGYQDVPMIPTGTTTLLLLSGGAGADISHGNFHFRGGPIFNYPLSPSLGNNLGAIGMNKRLMVTGFGELGWKFLIAGYQQNRFQLDTSAGSTPVAPLSEHTLHIPYVGVTFGHPIGVVFMAGPAAEHIRLLGDTKGVRLADRAFIFGVGFRFGIPIR